MTTNEPGGTRQHHTFGAPHPAGHCWRFPPICRRTRTPEAERKARSRPLVKAGGGVAPVTISSLEDAAHWLREVEGFACGADRKSIGRALTAYVAYRIEVEQAELRRAAGHA